ncbi:MAG: hypothetical protein LBG46_00565 [Elusimicrobiota bacterium]|jgi:Zn-dependent metalloprotease|nr:hypothetical protein [Elusimicrobiota bacterium]
MRLRLKKNFSILFSLILFSQQVIFAAPFERAAARDYGRFRKVYSSGKQTPEVLPAETFNKLEKFNKKTRSTWNIRMNRKSGAPRSLTGGKDLRVGRTESAALSFLNSNKDFLGVDRRQLRLKLQRKSTVGSHFYFDQYYKNLKVETAYVKVNVDNSGALLNYQSTYIPDIKIDIKPSKTAAEVSSIAASDAGGIAGKAELVISPNPENKEPSLAWKIEVQGGPSEPGKWIYFISASDGAIFNRISSLRFAIDTFAAELNPVYPEFTGATPAQQPLSDMYIYVFSQSLPIVVPYITNENGQRDTPDDRKRLYAAFSGPYFNISDQQNIASNIPNNLSGYYIERGTGTPYEEPVDTYLNIDTIAVTPANLTVATYADCSDIGSDYYNALSSPIIKNFNVGVMDIYGTITNKAFFRMETSILQNPTQIMAKYIGKPGNTFLGPIIANETASQTAKYALETYPPATSAALPDIENIARFCVRKDFNSSYNKRTTHIVTSQNSNNAPAANAFYNLNKMRQFFDKLDTNNGSNLPYIDLDTPLPVVINAHGQPYQGNGMTNAFYDTDAKVLMFGQGRKSGSQFYNFALESAIVRHEYVHAVVDRIWPIMYFGEGAAISEALSDYFALSSLVQTDGVTPYTSKIGVYVFGDSNVRDLAGTGPEGIFDPVRWEQNAFSNHYNNSLVLSRTLWDLRTGSVGQATDKILWNALMFFPDSLLEMRDAMIAADNVLNGGSNVAAIEAAFDNHNIKYNNVITPSGDIYEPNNSPDSAADIDIASIAQKEITASINPINDIDYYSISLPPGEFEAKLYLPQVPNFPTYYPLALLLLNANLKTVVDLQHPLRTLGQMNQSTPSEYVQLKYTVPETASGGTGRYILGIFKPDYAAYPQPIILGRDDSRCADDPSYTLGVPPDPDERCSFNSADGFCTTNPGDARCDTGRPKVTAYPTDAGKYKLVFNYTKGSNVGGFDPNVANFDNGTTIDFKVPCNIASNLPAGGSTTILAGLNLDDWIPQSVEAFNSVRLLDENMQPINNGSTDDNFYLKLNTSNSCSLNGLNYEISGQVEFENDFNTSGHDLIYLQVLGKIRSNEDANSENIPLCSSSNPPPTPCYRNDYGIVSLGISNPMRNSVQRSMGIYIRNQIFNPAKGGKVKIQLNAKQNGHIKAQIFTIDGILVKSLYDGQITTALPEFVDWDGKNDSGNTVASGVYLLRVDGAGIDRQVKKIVAVK